MELTETAKRYKNDVAIAAFLRKVEAELSTDKSPLKLWIRREVQPMGESGICIESELYVTADVYASRLVRFFRWITFQGLPYIVRTRSIYGQVDSIEVGDKTVSGKVEQIWEEIIAEAPALTSIKLLLADA